MTTLVAGWWHVFCEGHEHLSHNQNPVLKWLTQNHASGKYKGGRSCFWLGLSLANFHLSPGFEQVLIYSCLQQDWSTPLSTCFCRAGCPRLPMAAAYGCWSMKILAAMTWVKYKELGPTAAFSLWFHLPSWYRSLPCIPLPSVNRPSVTQALVFGSISWGALLVHFFQQPHVCLHAGNAHTYIQAHIINTLACMHAGRDTIFT